MIIRNKGQAIFETDYWDSEQAQAGDAYSAFLAREVEDGAHNPSRLATSWAAAEALLRRAGLCKTQSASGATSVKPTAPVPSESIVRRRGLAGGHGQVPHGPGDPVGDVLKRTPRL